MKSTSRVLLALLLAAAPAGAQRRADAHRVYSDSLPRAVIALDPALTYLGTQSFVLYNIANAEQHFFAELDGKRIKRFVWIQFEGYLPSSNGRYDYHADSLIQLWGRPVHVNTDTYTSPVTERRPDSDGAMMRKFIRERGLTIDSKMLYHRLVTMADATSRNELMIIYMEDAALYGQAGAALPEQLAASLERAKRNITVGKR